MSGATLPEVLIAAAIASIVLGGLMMGSMVLLRSFSTSDRLSRAQADLLRVSDYMARDIRNATSLQAATSASELLTVTTNDYYHPQGTPNNSTDDTPRDPVLGRHGVTYGNAPITIRYLRSGTGVLRQVARPNSDVSTTRVADAVDNLSVAVEADGTVRISSATTTRYVLRTTGSPAPIFSLVMASKPRNPSP